MENLREIEQSSGFIVRPAAPPPGAVLEPPIRKTSAPLHPGWVWALLVTCNLIWAGQFVMVKLVQAQLGPIMTTFLPMLFATMLLAPFALWRRVRSLRWDDVRSFCLLGVLGQVVAQLGITWGLRYAAASNAAVLMLALPVFTALMAHYLLSERMSRRRWISFVLAIVGAVVCSNIDLRGLEIDGVKGMVGNALILLSIAGSAFYNVYSKRILERFTPIEILFYSYCVVVVVLAPVALILEPLSVGDMRSLTLATWAGIGALAIFVYLGSMLVFFAALERLDAIQASLGNYLIPFFGLIIAAIALGERLTWAIIAGGLLALGSTVLGTIERKARA